MHTVPQRTAGRPRRAFIAACGLGLLAAIALPLQAQEPRLIRVQGEAERRVAPDMATLRAQVVTDAREAATARAAADAVLRKALALLRDRGVAKADIDSTGLSITPQYRWLKEPREQELTGYRVTRELRVRVLALETLGDILEGLSTVGVNRVQPPQLGLQDEEALYREVLAAAALNARDRAAAMAAALGESLAAVVSLTAEDAVPPRPQPRLRESAMLAADAGGAPQDSYRAGEMNYRVAVSAAFALRGRTAAPAGDGL